MAGSQDCKRSFFNPYNVKQPEENLGDDGGVLVGSGMRENVLNLQHCIGLEACDGLR